MKVKNGKIWVWNFIGDQSSKEFWQEFFDKVGMVDIILDDELHKWSPNYNNFSYC